METFYKQEDLEVFRKWVYYQVTSDPRLKLEKYDSRTYKIYYKNRVARFVVWPIGNCRRSDYGRRRTCYFIYIISFITFIMQPICFIV